MSERELLALPEAELLATSEREVFVQVPLERYDALLRHELIVDILARAVRAAKYSGEIENAVRLLLNLPKEETTE